MASPIARKRRLTSNLESVEAELTKLRIIRGRPDLTREEKLDILFVYFNLYVQSFAEKESAPVNALSRTARILGRSKGTVSKVVKDWSNHSIQSETSNEPLDLAVSAESNRGNRSCKQWRIPNSQLIYHDVRDFVRLKRSKFECVTSKEVLEFLISKQYLNVTQDSNGCLDKTALSTARRSVQRWLLKNGFSRGKKSKNLLLSNKITAWRNKYLRIIMENRGKIPTDQLQEVYLDESYIHQHYSKSNNSLYDPNDNEDIQSRQPHKGRRICFLAAIKNSIGDEKAGFVANSAWWFIPKGKNAHGGDYHKSFNSHNFLAWFRQNLMPNLNRPSLIIMDNAAYHKTLPENTPKPYRMKKEEVIETLNRFGIQHEPEISGIEAKILLKSWITCNIKPAVTTIAEEHGHKVVFTPPYHSDLQPIELYWAFIKGNVGRQYTAGTSLKDVVDRLRQEFINTESETGSNLIQKMMLSVDKTILKFIVDLESEEKNSSDTETESESSEGSEIE